MLEVSALPVRTALTPRALLYPYIHIYIHIYIYKYKYIYMYEFVAGIGTSRGQRAGSRCSPSPRCPRGPRASASPSCRTCDSKVDIRLPGKGNSSFHGAMRIRDTVDLDQQVVNKELSLSHLRFAICRQA